MVLRYTTPPTTPPPEPGTAKIFLGRLVHSTSPTAFEILPHAAVGVHPNGTIAFVDTSPHSPTAEAIRSLHAAHQDFLTAQVLQLKPSQFLFPGLVDTHLHAPQWINLALGMDGTLREWMEEYTDPEEASFSDLRKAEKIYAEVVATTLALGSTTVAYNGSLHLEATKALARECWLRGQRAVVGKMCVTTGSTQGNWEDSVAASLESTQQLINYVHTLCPPLGGDALVRASVQPRGGPYCPPALMAGLGALCTLYPNLLVQGHMCETPSDITRTLALHPPFTSYSAMYRHHNLLHPLSIQAHSIHLQPADLENLRETGAGVAHCPTSNTVLRDGVCDVRRLLDAGVKVGLGTDCSAGYMPSILQAMRAASSVSRHLAMHTRNEHSILSFPELLYMATLGGAAVLGLQGKVGRFAPGMEFDALVVDVAGVISAGPELWGGGEGGDAEAMVRKWVFLGDERAVRRVFVGGREVGGCDRGV
ncbi:hypothetical protein LTR08_002928 [Meristemomyces frigidus]|nr:hypothetical protein LTR08_002928 [Meristemomyces frigidus]